MWNGTWNSHKTTVTGIKWNAIDWRISTKNKTGFTSLHLLGRHNGLMVSTLISGSSGPGSSPQGGEMGYSQLCVYIPVYVVTWLQARLEVTLL